MIINEFISTILQFAAAAAAAAAVMRLQGCSCSNSILLNQLRMSNNPCVQNLVIINQSFPKLFNLLSIPAPYLKKVLQLQHQLQHQQIFWHHDLDPHTKWGKVNEFQKKILRFSSYYRKTIGGGQIGPPPWLLGLRIKKLSLRPIWRNLRKASPTYGWTEIWRRSTWIDCKSAQLALKRELSLSQLFRKSI